MRRDYTRGGTARNILRLGLPMSLEMILLSTYSLVDMFFISRFLGKEAVAAVGLSGAVLLIPISLSIGLGNAYLMILTRRIGEKNLTAAWVVLGQVVWLSTICGLFIGLAGYALAASSLRWMGASPLVVRCGCAYLKQRLLWIVLANLLFGLNSCLRGAGNAKAALLILAIANLSNIALDPVLIGGLWKIPAYGISGAAYATIFSQGLGLVVQIILLARGTDRLRLTWKTLKFDLAITCKILRQAIFTVPHFFFRLSSALFLNALVAFYGTTAIAAFAIAMRFNMFVCFPMFGVGNAISALVGQNLGAKLPERAKKTARQGIYYAVFYMSIVGVVFWFFSPQLLALMKPEPEVLTESVRCLRFFACTYPCFAVSAIVNYAFLGAGNARTPLKLDILNRWLCRIGGGYVFSRVFDLGIIGVWTAVCAGEVIQCIIGRWLLSRGKWTKIEL